MTSDGGRSEFRQVWVCVCCERQRGAIGFRQGGNRVRAKNEGVFSLKQGNVATFGCNVATFQRGKQPT